METKDTLLGIDLGFGSLKSMLIESDGTVLARASCPVPTSHARPGWSEQDPLDWYVAIRTTVAEIRSRQSAALARIRGVALTAGTHSNVLTGEDGVPLRPAIMWNDQRSGEEAAWLFERHGDEILGTGYQKVTPTWTLAQFLWLNRHEPEIAAKVRRVYSAKDYLRHLLTGDWCTDRVDAMGMLFLDMSTGGWSERLCELAGWSIETLPPVRDCFDSAGRITGAAARECGLPPRTEVFVGSSDTAVELFGAGCIRPGQGLVKLATAGTVSLTSDSPHPGPTVINYYNVIPGLWYIISATNSCGSSHAWLRDRLFEPDARGTSFARMDEEASRILPGAEGLLFHPYLLGERSPYWDPRLRGDFIGLTLSHDRGHLVRALYEGIAFSLLDCYRTLEEKGLVMNEVRIVGGGARSATWRGIVADVLGLDLAVPKEADACFGAALIAGVGSGIYADGADAVARAVRVGTLTRVEPDNRALYDELFGLYRETVKALRPICHALDSRFAKRKRESATG